MRKLYCSDEGIVSTDGNIGTEEAAMLGRNAALLSRSIIVGYKPSAAGKALSLAFAAAALEGGADVYSAGDVSLPELFFCAEELKNTDCLICYIGSVYYPSFRFFNGKGTELDCYERLIAEQPPSFDSFGRASDISSLCELYPHRVRKLLFGTDFADFRYSAVFNSPSPRIRELCTDIFPETSGGEILAFHIGEDGAKVTAFTESTGYISCDKLMLLALRFSIFCGQTVYLPKDFPSAAERIAEEKNVKIVRCDRGELPFLYDKIILTAIIFKIIQKEGKPLGELCKMLPDYAELSRYLPIERENCINLIKKLCSEYNNGRLYNMDKDFSKGITIDGDLGRISVTPIRSGKGLMLRAECNAMEAAAELCNIYEEKLKNIR